ncbi:MAG TPA: GH116 family glycosyl-hydrolase [Bryobacteraceae bacterium]|nr:GH116 family glycosyl-hydrolase [Bryobacteraceae bacterium]HOQ46646.1 GH116 family glycosyl-hydrolase [Bryobacteraceae bacterium]HPQ17103.1 GH116 family glycosyl-hydrolase [Bryobacteraceae bacterium]HPU72316.1 GH116 family glycosyl-hydrolase [Bryobacteraceae bacterium]
MATKRRDFLKTAALIAGAAPAQASQAPAAQTTAEAAPQAASRGAAPRRTVQYPRVLTGRNLAMVAFPLGGVAAGSVSLGGRGQLRDWEIFNRPDKGRSLNYAFPSIWVQAGNSKPVARVLEARMMPPYHAAHGLSPNNVSGLTRLDGATFTGEYPLATVAFRDRKLPVRVTLEAFTPIFPLAADDSGLPIAVLRYKVRNPGKQTAKVSIAFSLENPVGTDRGPGARGAARSRVNEFRTGAGLQGLLMTNPGAAKDAPMNGSMALCVLDAGDGKVSYLRGWPEAKWWRSALLFWDDFTQDGQLGPEAEQRNQVGSICLSRELAPGAEADFTFLLAWHFPNRTPQWCGWTAPKGENNTIIGNYYCQRFADAWAAAEHAAANLPVLEKRMRQFLAAMRESTLPAPVKEAAMANLSTLATQVCFRTADGRFRGFEGASDNSGCCFGNCSHVWNYEAVTQHLFPSLARSQREAGFETAEKLDGILPIRIQLPEGKQTSHGITAIDGTMGQIIRTYLDWRLSGDDAWLRSMWPKVKKAMEFAWIEGGWDADRDGVAEGVQHNTFDVEFYGPNPMCGIYYLGGLRACEEMARATGDEAFARTCRDLFTRGSKWIDENLFNGEYYIQKVQGIPPDKIAKPLRSQGGAEDPLHPDFQAGEGCLADQLVGQYVAMVAGLGSLVDPAKIRKTLASIYKYNYRHNLEDHESIERIYALNDEAGLLLCDYGKAPRPRIPFPYFSEVWTGFEYEIAALMMYYGMPKEAIEIVTNARLRYDGERRNPWDELECGHHYVRAMASWSGILALSGFRYHGTEKSVVAAPRVNTANFRSFWSTGTGWGTFSQAVQQGRTRFRLSVLYGKLPCQTVELARNIPAGAKTTARLGGKPVAHELRREQGRAVFVFAQPLEIAEGEQLELEA